MNVLIIGFSSIVKRRVLLALWAHPAVERIHLASRRNISPEVIPVEKRGKIYDGYAAALSECEPCLAYISLPNSLHAEWAGKALEAGFHVIVDKPSVTDISDARSLVGLAQSKLRCLAEANVWYHHPLAKNLKSLIEAEGSQPIALSTVFTSPLADPGTIHYNSELGGGVLFDRGPYAVSCGRFFFGGMPQEVICRKTLSGGVDLSCSIMLRYGESTLFSFLSLAAEYRNTLSVTGSTYHLEVERIFTPPVDYEGVISVRRKNELETISVQPSDTFLSFIGDVLSSIEDGSFGRFSRLLLEDAQVMEDLKASARGDKYDH